MSKIKIKANTHLLIGLGMFLFFLIGAFVPGQARANADLEGIVFKPEVSYTAENLRDPFINPVQTGIFNQAGEADLNVSDAPLPAMRVQGIFWGGKFPQAIINGKIVKVGEKIDGAQIVSIEKDLIKVFFGNKQFVLPSPASDNLANSFNKKDGKKGGNQ